MISKLEMKQFLQVQFSTLSRTRLMLSVRPAHLIFSPFDVDAADPDDETLLGTQIVLEAGPLGFSGSNCHSRHYSISAWQVSPTHYLLKGPWAGTGQGCGFKPLVPTQTWTGRLQCCCESKMDDTGA